MQCNIWCFKEFDFPVTTFISSSKLVRVKCCKCTKNNTRMTKPRVHCKMCFQSSTQGFSHPSQWLQVNSCWLLSPWLPQEPGFRTHHSQVTHCHQPLENRSFEKQDGKTNCHGFRAAHGAHSPKVHAGQLLFILYKLKFFRLKRGVGALHIHTPWKKKIMKKVSRHAEW